MSVHIALSALLIAAYLYWRSAQQVKETALAAPRRQCRSLEVQMLDGYVALTGWALARDCSGKIRIKRQYQFEFSATGEDRYEGICEMLGREVVKIELAAHRFPVD